MKTRVRTRLSDSALFIRFSVYLFRVERGPLYHDDYVCSVQKKKGGVWVPVNLALLSMTRGGQDTALHVIDYIDRTSTTRMARQPRSNRNDHHSRSVVGSLLPRDVQFQIPTSPINQHIPPVEERSTYSYDLIPFSPLLRYSPSLQLSHMRNNNDREDYDEEYTGDSTAYYQACFVSFGSPVLSALDLLGGRS